MDKLMLEIISCENGYIVLEGNSLASNQPYHQERRKWAALDVDGVCCVIRRIAGDSKQLKPSPASPS